MTNVVYAQAHEALTDEAARENYEKFGNPDGKQALAVSLYLYICISMYPYVHVYEVVFWCYHTTTSLTRLLCLHRCLWACPRS